MYSYHSSVQLKLWKNTQNSNNNGGVRDGEGQEGEGGFAWI